MELIKAIVGGLTLGLFMALSVGPTLFAIIRYSLNHSYRTGLAFVLGVSFSDIMYVAIANLATSWLEFLHRYEKVLAYGGGALLLIVGLLGFAKKYKPVRPKRGIQVITNGHYFRIFASGFLQYHQSGRRHQLACGLCVGSFQRRALPDYVLWLVPWIGARARFLKSVCSRQHPEKAYPAPDYVPAENHLFPAFCSRPAVDSGSHF